jgi:hypothetical protein
MSVQIRISYEHDRELQDIISRLNGLGIKTKCAEQKGRYKRAYLTQCIDIPGFKRYNAIVKTSEIVDTKQSTPSNDGSHNGTGNAK